MLLKTGNFKGVPLNQIGGHNLRVPLWGLQVQDAIQLRGRNIVAMRINREKHLLWSGRILLSPDGTMSNPKVYLIVTNDMFERD
jgi:hypothetical protein